MAAAFSEWEESENQMTEEEKSTEHVIHVTQEEMEQLNQILRQRDAGDPVPSEGLATLVRLILREPSNPDFVSLEDDANQLFREEGVPPEQAKKVFSTYLSALRDNQTVIHFTTQNKVLGPGRLIGYDLDAKTVIIQLLGDNQLLEFPFASINNFGPAVYNNPRTVGQTLLGAFWEARTTRKYLERMVANSYARLSPEEIDSFEKISGVSETDVVDLVPLELAEAEVKEHICSIVGEPFVQKDWGGEICDIFCNLRFRRRSVPAAFLLKGKSYAHRPLRIADLGKNGDQLVRMFFLQAQIFVIQSNGPIDGTIYNQIQAQVAEKLMSNQPVYYLVMDGVQTARLLRAYGKI